MDIQMSKDLNYVFNALTTHDAIKRHNSAVMGYICLFGVTPFHLKAPKFRRIMEEMVKLFDAQAFSYQKKTYAISHSGIVEALDVCIKKNFEGGLENHNYLKKIMIGISEREGKDKSRTAEKDLRKREGNAVARGVHPEEVPVQITEEQAKKNLTKVRDLLGGLAK
jgi:hypothetical protein